MKCKTNIKENVNYQKGKGYCYIYIVWCWLLDVLILCIAIVFFAEATQLLINSIFLYEEGYFDCAFYSVRQASEVFNAMLYLSEDKDEWKKWATIMFQENYRTSYHRLKILRRESIKIFRLSAKQVVAILEKINGKIWSLMFISK